jgi:hypothetical protein
LLTWNQPSTSIENPTCIPKEAQIAMRKGLLVTISIVALISASLAYGQSVATQPKPGPEHQKLGALVGTWTSEGEATANPFGPAEKWSSRIVTEWFNGNFAVVRRSEGKGTVSGNNTALDVIA